MALTSLDAATHVPRSGRRWLVACFVALVACSLVSLCLYTLDEPFSVVERLRTLRTFGNRTARPSQLDLLFPLPDTEFHDFWPNENNRHMHALISCIASDTCGVNQTKIVIFASWDFTYAIEGRVSGENIWANSIMDALDALGYTYFFAFNHDQLAERYRAFPELVKVVIAQSPLVHDCLNDPECIKSPINVLGVPLWKMFGFEFWENSYMPHPLGKPWTLSPVNYASGNTFLGYSVNRTCSLQPFIPHDKRDNQVFVLAKRLSYFFGDRYAWPNVDYSQPPATLKGLSFVAAVWNDTSQERNRKYPVSPKVPKGVVALNDQPLLVDEFFLEVASSKLLLGIGDPPLSPSPYDALCLGVPFLNPVVSYDKANPENRTAWITQHDGLKFQPEPYVYHVLKHPDMETRTRLFWEAAERAVSTPIQRYMPEEMTPAAVTARVSAFVEADWRSRAELVIEEFKAQGKKLTGLTL
ncbi:hypothetical protein EXIGLDRAFT_827749 [Exidia glandulosa HHB12029]|uniref:Uncharacterized protein n=1 Tax=Exidia glandulosa HHB12029 TaxID=1314781 RepID=A0A165QLM2_EXIGL|nr:hypothetical protein EXIGLDRAFT_827749 [Exidia glandulosa HHB12029]